MSDRILRRAIVGLSLAGIGVSGYLLSVRWTKSELLCSTGGCETVQNSTYAELLGFPVAGLGIAGYVLIGAWALGGGAIARGLVTSLALAAVAFGAYLLVIQLVVIEAVCEWCLVSDAIASLIAVAAVARLLRVPPGVPT